MEKVFVTGGDGMLGSNVVRELLNRNYQLSVLVQKGRETGTLSGLNITRVEGDLLDRGSIEEAVAGHDYVIHIAASTSIWPSRNEIINKVNIDGTRNILEACLKHNVKRLIHVGTANTFGFGTRENPGDEKKPYASARYGLDYMDSKYKAHQLVMEYVKKGVNALVVNPTFMIGPYDSAPSSGAMIVAIYKGKVPGYSPGGRNYICVKDVAVAIANALTKGRIGEGYILGNENLNYREAFNKIAKVIGKKSPQLKMPSFVILSYAVAGSFFAQLAGKKPTVSRAMAKIACDEHYFTSKKAITELDLPQTPIENGILDCYNWLNENGYLK